MLHVFGYHGVDEELGQACMVNCAYDSNTVIQGLRKAFVQVCGQLANTAFALFHSRKIWIRVQDMDLPVDRE